MRLRATARRARAVGAAVLAAGLLALSGAPAGAAVAASPAGAPVTPATPAAPAAPPAPAAPSTSALPVGVAVTSVSPQVLRPDQDLTVTATLRNDGERVVEQARASVRLYRYRMSSRDEVAAWADAGTTRPVGDVAATTVLDQPLPPGGSATVQITVPAADVGLLRTEEAWGPRGLTVDVTDGRSRVGIDRTFLLWGSATEVPTTQVGVLAPVVGPATVPAADAADDATEEASGTPAPTGTPTSSPGPGTPTAGTPVPADALTTSTAAGGRLARLLQATADAPVVSWAVDPALVDQAAAGSRAAQSWLGGLTEAAADREVLRLPWADPDLAAVAHAAAAAAGTDLLDLALQVAGGGASSTLLGDADPVLWSADPVPDDVTAARAAASAPGVPLVVGPDALPADDSDAPSAPVAVGTDGGPVTALVPDATLSELLADPAEVQPGVTPATAAQRLLAETAVLARSSDAADTYLLAALPRDWAPTAAVAQAQLAALSAAPWVQPTTVAELLTAHAAGRADGDGAARADLPGAERGGAELTPAWVGALAARWAAAQDFATVVPDPAALLRGLDADVVTPLAVAWRADPDGRAAAVNAALDLVTQRQAGLTVVPNEQFTVISSSAQISVAVRNDLDQDARVRVELRPRKGCLDTARSEITDAVAGQDTPVTMTLRANANCDVTVDVSLVSESGRELATPVSFSARVAPTIEDVGLVVVGGMLALALAFGIWRTVRRGQTTRRGARVAPDTADGAPGVLGGAPAAADVAAPADPGDRDRPTDADPPPAGQDRA
jgi:hypothetical protein